MRRSGPVVLIAAGLIALLGAYVWYAQRVVTELDREARHTAELFSRVYAAVASPSNEGDDRALQEVLETLQEFRVPMIVTDASGRPSAARNLPFTFDDATSDARVAAYVATLDRQNPPVGDPRISLVHFGKTPLVQGLEVIPTLLAALVGILIIIGAGMLRTRSRADREHVWAGMAREAAHQLGTPISSLNGWVELLGARADGDPRLQAALPHIVSDVERLERVAHRFERIGRPPRRDPVDVNDVVTQVVEYYRRRVPTLANAITIDVQRADGALRIPGDRVLLEWAVESLVKNAVDALGDRGGHIVVTVEAGAGSGARIRVADDGPGIPAALRGKVFAAGFSTKERGWGIGLPLARRIVKESHGGRLELAASDRGAAFDIILPG